MENGEAIEEILQSMENKQQQHLHWRFLLWIKYILIRNRSTVPTLFFLKALLSYFQVKLSPHSLAIPTSPKEVFNLYLFIKIIKD